MLENKLIERLLDSFHVEFVLLETLRCQIFQVRPIELLIDGQQVVLQARYRGRGFAVQEDELVWDYTHLLQGQRLCLGPWESLYDPTLSLRLTVLDLLLDYFNDHFIVD